MPRGPLPPADIRIGTTIATDALRVQTGMPVLLAITRGFGDATLTGAQERPDIFTRAIHRPPPLQVETLAIVRAHRHHWADRSPDRGLRAIAIMPLQGYRHRALEKTLAAIAREIGFGEIAVGHRVSALVRSIARADTVLVDANLSTVLRRHVERLCAAFGDVQTPLLMQSDGGSTAASAFRGRDAVLSGSASGIVGMAATSSDAEFDRAVEFDMRGTSTDIFVHAGTPERGSDASIAGVRISTPMLRIHTVAAGGGAICRTVAGRFVVGPESASADPGPACYLGGGRAARDLVHAGASL